MKTLVAAACLAVLAAVSFYFWGEYRQMRRATEIQAGRESARQELFQLSGAKSFETEKVRDFCKRMSDKRYRENDNSDFVRILVRNCGALGFD